MGRKGKRKRKKKGSKGIHREFFALPLEDRIEAGLDSFSRVFSWVHEKQPLWPVLFSVQLIRDSLVSLRENIETAGDTEEAWSQPSIEMRFPVSWDFETNHIVYEGWDEEGFRDEKSVLATLERTLHEGLHVFLFESLTRGTAIARFSPETIEEARAEAEGLTADELVEDQETEDARGPWAVPVKEGEEWGPLVTEEMAELLERGEGVDLNKLLEPFVFFVKREGLTEKLKTPPKSKRDAQDILRGVVEKFLCNETFSEEPLGLTGTDSEGRPFSVRIVPAVYHLVVGTEDELVRNPETGEITRSPVFYPLTVELKLEGEGAKPWEWDPEDRGYLWSQILKAIDLLSEELQEAQKITLEDWSREERKVPLEGTLEAKTELTGELESKGAFPTIAPSEKLVPAQGFPIAFALTTVDANVQAFVANLHSVRFPIKKWKTLPKWEDLVSEEIQRIKDEEGDAAFEDLRETTGDPGARGKLLKKRYRTAKDSHGNALKDASGEAIMEEVLELTSEAEKRLKVSKGLARGYRKVSQDGKEYLVRLFQVGSGYAGIGFSWYGVAGPWVEEWRKDLEKKAESLKSPKGQLALRFEDLPEDKQAEVDRFLSHVRSLKNGHRIMEMAIAQVGVQGQNPVQIPAVAMRELLGLQESQNWKRSVDGALDALKEIDFRVDSFDLSPKLKVSGRFLGEWRYHGAGAGRHGGGDYLLFLQPGFLGCLSAFESDKRKLPSGWGVTQYNLRKKLTERDRETWGWDSKEKDGSVTTSRKTQSSWTHFDAGRPFYNSAEGFTSAQEKLHAFVEKEITLNKDPAATKRKGVQISPRKEGAGKPRLYGRDFCPLLDEGKLYQGALGHFRANPETGRTLVGARARASATGGPHSEGLIGILGRSLPPGRAHVRRADFYRKTLEDFKAVVEEYLGGVVAVRLRGKDGDRWLSLKEAGDLREAELKKARFYFFLPKDWREERTRKWEERSGWRASKTTEEAEKAREALRGQLDEGTEVPLRELLRAKRTELGLSQGGVGALFGVSQKTVSKWENGPEPDEEGKVRGKPIPLEVVPLLQRWVETGEAPSKEELEARKTSR